MLTFIDLLIALLPLSYGLAAVSYAVYFTRGDAFAERTCTPALVVTVGLHALLFVLRYVYFERYPVATMPEVLSAVAFAVAAVYLYVERIQHNKATGFFLTSLAAILQLIASALLPHSSPAEASLLLHAPLWGAHTTAAVLGHSAFAVSAVYGLMYLLLYRALKQKRFGLVYQRLPSLDVLVGMGMGAAFFGLVFLTLTIALGAFMSAELVPHFYSDPRVVSAAIVWCIYAAAVGAYFVLGWRGARAVYLTLAGFATAVVTTVGSELVWHTFHSFSA